MIQSRRAFSWQSYWKMRGGGQREREKKKKISSGAEEPLAFRKEEHQKSSFLPSFLFLRLEKHKTHAHTCTKWIGDLIQWFLATRLIRFSFFFFLLLLFLFRDGWSSRHLCSVSYFAGNFISTNFGNICCCCCEVGLFVCRSAFDQFPTHVYTVKSCLHLLFCRAAIFSLLCGFLRLRLGGKNVSLVLTDDQSIIISARLVAVLSNPAALFPVPSPFIRDWQFLVSTSCLYHKFDKGSCR